MTGHPGLAIAAFAAGAATLALGFVYHASISSSCAPTGAGLIGFSPLFGLGAGIASIGFGAVAADREATLRELGLLNASATILGMATGIVGMALLVWDFVASIAHAFGCVA